MSEEKKEQSPILTYMNEVMDKFNKRDAIEKKKKALEDQRKALTNSYGAVMLENGLILAVKYNFYYLKELWKQYTMAKEMKMKNELKEFLEKTNGGLFNCGDMTFKFSDIKMIFDTELYYNSTGDEKNAMDLKSAMINSYMGLSIVLPPSEADFFDEDDDDY